MLKEKINELREKMEKQISSNRPYQEIYTTSVMIDDLLVKYYKKYGISGNKEELV